MKKTNPSQLDLPFVKPSIGIYDGANCKYSYAYVLGQALSLTIGADILGYKPSGKPEKTMFVTAGLSKKRIIRAVKNLTGNADLLAHQNLKIVISDAFSGPLAIDLSTKEGRNSFDQMVDPDCKNLFLYDYKAFNGKSSGLDSDQYLKALLSWAEGYKAAGCTVIFVDCSFSILDHPDLAAKELSLDHLISFRNRSGAGGPNHLDFNVSWIWGGEDQLSGGCYEFFLTCKKMGKLGWVWFHFNSENELNPRQLVS